MTTLKKSIQLARARFKVLKKSVLANAVWSTSVLLISMSLLACTPKYDWREIRSVGENYAVLLPAKPSTYTRSINLGGITAEMTMTAAEVDNVTFAVGTAELPDAPQAQAVLLAIKATLVKNINGVIRHEKMTQGPNLSNIEIDAAAAIPMGLASSRIASIQPKTGTALALHARLVARDRRVYQVIVIGKEKEIRQEAVDTFLTSFKLQ